MLYQRLLRERTLFLMTLRKMGWLYFAPPAVLFLFIPLLSAGRLLTDGHTETAYVSIFFDFQQTIPFISCWWVLFGLSDYVDEASGEVLRVYKKSLLDLFWMLLGWYALHVAALFAVYGLALDNYWREFPVILGQMLAFSAVSFFLLEMTKTLLAPFLVALLYELLTMVTNATPLRFLTIFFVDRVSAPSQWIPYGILALCSAALVFLSDFCFRKGTPHFKT